MLKPTLILPNVTHQIDIVGDGGFLGLAGPDGIGFLLFVTVRKSDETLIVNDCIDEKWGQEVTLPTSEAEDPESGRFAFRFDGRKLTLWNGKQAMEFDRFGPERAEHVRFYSLNHARNDTRSLDIVANSLDAALLKIDGHILHKRMDDMDRRLQAEDRADS